MDWFDFYEERINSTYQIYFEYRYHPFLNPVLHEAKKQGGAIDAGCGIGSVSKYLKRYGITTLGFDLSPQMVALSQRNVPDTHFSMGDIMMSNSDMFMVTHGVLEHFEDVDIQHILEKNPNSMHYVPLEGYPIQSFGDERLLPKEYWLDTFKPEVHETFNNGKDLFFHYRK